MKLKSYFSGTVEAAIELAHKELGEEALLVNVRPAAIETRHLGAYEVVFGVNTEATGNESGGDRAAKTAPKPGTPAARDPTPDPRIPDRWNPDRWNDDMADLRRQVARIGDSLRGARSYTASFPAGSAAARSEMCSRLIEAELDPELAQLVAQGTPLEELCLSDASLGRPAAARAVVAVVGPPGAGKTSTLVKLAARYGIGGCKRTQILSADVHRVAAADQLRTLAAILGLGCDVVETPVALRQALEEHRLKELVLIDTPGLAWADLEDGRELARTLAANEEVDTHLVLPASMKPADMTRVAAQFAMFQPAKLLFTRLDETTRFGALVSESVRTGKPVSFLATGQEIPDALEAATSSRLAELVLGRPADPGPPEKPASRVAGAAA
jgi:flagellar biosynthesis protein FlhF